MPEPTVLLLSTSDTDLISARSSGKNYRWANPSRLSDLELTDLLAEASIVVIGFSAATAPGRAESTR